MTLTEAQLHLLSEVKRGLLLELTQTGYRLDGIIVDEVDVTALRKADLIVMRGGARYGYAQFGLSALAQHEAQA